MLYFATRYKPIEQTPLRDDYSWSTPDCSIYKISEFAAVLKYTKFLNIIKYFKIIVSRYAMVWAFCHNIAMSKAGKP